MAVTLTTHRTFPSRELDQFNVRLPKGLRAKLSKLAERNNRSMNSEIVSILEATVDLHFGEIKHNATTMSPTDQLRLSIEKLAEDTNSMKALALKLLPKTR